MFQINAKNGTVFHTEDDALAASLKRQGHTVTEVEDDAILAASSSRRRSSRPTKEKASEADVTVASPEFASSESVSED